ncbi:MULTISPECIES: hypothetical protein [unclassified Paenibacillus]|uniref:hypothetical protein n=1 Tax=unclassified Paenibacillus TaxID=185978 RepID=UPI002405502F|nr:MULTISPECIES: hypothetical protein [unclassified Paenibacillus]MDF9845360.1 hypothetical protein [Paenibacillus sp. PastF-2]MDF9851955.1 hypothetical protein [Paenibacillus sp. PastM-2]MDF9858519.1 hypothetical protein [Paenibacillus sp. PastF-1]MDH6483772.1 hypothetical protein [Paenibacillus sp. PastH-2]MDH6511166.1 hypothetical protein [Paenibacillus sp. PastM-3]
MSTVRLLDLQMECSLYFEENPYTIENGKGMALRLGRTEEDLKLVLDKLSVLTILIKVGDGEQAYYRYNQPDVLHKVIL